MQWAMANGYGVFTHDLDFGMMLALSVADGPSVLQVRCLNVMPEAIGPLVLSVIRSY
jgi:predicted nuclease of predicted toxin-antitoxin system